MKLFRKMKERIRKQREKGVALFIALVALLLMAAIATGMMFMANTESAINYNYRDAQFTYFAAVICVGTCAWLVEAPRMKSLVSALRGISPNRRVIQSDDMLMPLKSVARSACAAAGAPLPMLSA